MSILKLDRRIEVAMTNNMGFTVTPEEVKHIATMVVALRKIARGSRSAKGLALSALTIAGFE